MKLVSPYCTFMELVAPCFLLAGGIFNSQFISLILECGAQLHLG
jgi:NAD(P)H-dependent flavin oxidoreductase YrpB (nitropropane dioxygenase family)